jgi:hypothetical protein
MGVVDLVAKGMAHMFGDTNNITNFLGAVRRETRFNCLVINLFPERESKENTDVNSDSGQCS